MSMLTLKMTEDTQINLIVIKLINFFIVNYVIYEIIFEDRVIYALKKLCNILDNIYQCWANIFRDPKQILQ